MYQAGPTVEFLEKIYNKSTFLSRGASSRCTSWQLNSASCSAASCSVAHSINSSSWSPSLRKSSRSTSCLNTFQHLANVTMRSSVATSKPPRLSALRYVYSSRVLSVSCCPYCLQLILRDFFNLSLNRLSREHTVAVSKAKSRKLSVFCWLKLLNETVPTCFQVQVWHKISPLTAPSDAEDFWLVHLLSCAFSTAGVSSLNAEVLDECVAKSQPKTAEVVSLSAEQVLRHKLMTNQKHKVVATSSSLGDKAASSNNGSVKCEINISTTVLVCTESDNDWTVIYSHGGSSIFYGRW